MSASLLKADSDHFPCHVGNVPGADMADRAAVGASGTVTVIGFWDARWTAIAERGFAWAAQADEMIA